MDKLPKTKDEIAQLIVSELRSFDCNGILAVDIVPISGDAGDTNWTVSRYNVERSDDEACDRALQHIVPRFQKVYALVQKH